jgi:hypothetical protein
MLEVSQQLKANLASIPILDKRKCNICNVQDNIFHFQQHLPNELKYIIEQLEIAYNTKNIIHLTGIPEYDSTLFVLNLHRIMV